MAKVLTLKDIKGLHKNGTSVGTMLLKNKTTFLSYVDVVWFNCGDEEFPVNLNFNLNVSNRMSFGRVKAKFRKRIFPTPPALSLPGSVICDGDMLLYCEIRAINDSTRNVAKTIEYLKLHEWVGVVNPPNVTDVKVLLIPTSTLSSELGITTDKYPRMLHALFIKRLSEDERVSSTMISTAPFVTVDEIMENLKRVQSTNSNIKATFEHNTSKRASQETNSNIAKKIKLNEDNGYDDVKVITVPGVEYATMKDCGVTDEPITIHCSTQVIPDIAEADSCQPDEVDHFEEMNTKPQVVEDSFEKRRVSLEEYKKRKTLELPKLSMSNITSNVTFVVPTLRALAYTSCKQVMKDRESAATCQSISDKSIESTNTKVEDISSTSRVSMPVTTSVTFCVPVSVHVTSASSIIAAVTSGDIPITSSLSGSVSVSSVPSNTDLGTTVTLPLTMNESDQGPIVTRRSPTPTLFPPMGTRLPHGITPHHPIIPNYYHAPSYPEMVPHAYTHPFVPHHVQRAHPIPWVPPPTHVRAPVPLHPDEFQQISNILQAKEMFQKSVSRTRHSRSRSYSRSRSRSFSRSRSSSRSPPRRRYRSPSSLHFKDQSIQVAPDTCRKGTQYQCKSYNIGIQTGLYKLRNSSTQTNSGHIHKIDNETQTILPSFTTSYVQTIPKPVHCVHIQTESPNLFPFLSIVSPFSTSCSEDATLKWLKLKLNDHLPEDYNDSSLSCSSRSPLSGCSDISEGNWSDFTLPLKDIENTSSHDESDGNTPFNSPKETTTSLGSPKNTTSILDSPKESTHSLGSPKDTIPFSGSSEEPIPSLGLTQETTHFLDSPRESTVSLGSPKGAIPFLGSSKEATPFLGPPKEIISSLSSLKKSTSTLDSHKEFTHSLGSPKDTIPFSGSSEEPIPSLGLTQETTHFLDSPRESTVSLGSPKEAIPFLGSSKEATPFLGSPKEIISSLGSLKKSTSTLDSRKESTHSLGSPKESTSFLGSPQDTTHVLGSPRESTTLSSPKGTVPFLGSSKEMISSPGSPRKTTPILGFSTPFSLLSTKNSAGIVKNMPLSVNASINEELVDPSITTNTADNDVDNVFPLQNDTTVIPLSTASVFYGPSLPPYMQCRNAHDLHKFNKGHLSNTSSIDMTGESSSQSNQNPNVYKTQLGNKRRLSASKSSPSSKFKMTFENLPLGNDDQKKNNAFKIHPFRISLPNIKKRSLSLSPQSNIPSNKKTRSKSVPTFPTTLSFLQTSCGSAKVKLDLLTCDSSVSSSHPFVGPSIEEQINTSTSISSCIGSKSNSPPAEAAHTTKSNSSISTHTSFKSSSHHLETPLYPKNNFTTSVSTHISSKSNFLPAKAAHNTNSNSTTSGCSSNSNLFSAEAVNPTTNNSISSISAHISSNSPHFVKAASTTTTVSCPYPFTTCKSISTVTVSNKMQSTFPVSTSQFFSIGSTSTNDNLQTLVSSFTSSKLFCSSTVSTESLTTTTSSIPIQMPIFPHISSYIQQLATYFKDNKIATNNISQDVNKVLPPPPGFPSLVPIGSLIATQPTVTNPLSSPILPPMLPLPSTSLPSCLYPPPIHLPFVPPWPPLPFFVPTSTAIPPFSFPSVSVCGDIPTCTSTVSVITSDQISVSSGHTSVTSIDHLKPIKSSFISVGPSTSFGFQNPTTVSPTLQSPTVTFINDLPTNSLTMQSPIFCTTTVQSSTYITNAIESPLVNSTNTVVHSPNTSTTIQLTKSTCTSMVLSPITTIRKQSIPISTAEHSTSMVLLPTTTNSKQPIPIELSLATAYTSPLPTALPLSATVDSHNVNEHLGLANNIQSESRPDSVSYDSSLKIARSNNHSISQLRSPELCSEESIIHYNLFNSYTSNVESASPISLPDEKVLVCGKDRTNIVVDTVLCCTSPKEIKHDNSSNVSENLDLCISTSSSESQLDEPLSELIEYFVPAIQQQNFDTSFDKPFLHEAKRRKTDYHNIAAVVVQAAWKGYATRKRYKMLHKGFILLQALIRGFLVRTKLKLMIKSCITLQKVVRRYLVHRKYKKIYCVVVFLQSFVRGMLVRRKVRTIKSGVVKFQALYRQFKAQQHYLLIKESIVTIQAWYRGCKERKRWLHYKQCVIKIQALYRGKTKRVRWHEYKEDVIRVQSLYRSNRNRKLWQQYRRCVIRVQSLYRGNRERKQWQKYRQCVIRVQSFYRGSRERKHWEKYRQCVIRVQSLYRGSRERKHWQKYRQCVVRVQSLYRSSKERKLWLQYRRCVIRIQAWYRSKREKTLWHEYKKGVITVQSLYRCSRERKWWLQYRESVIRVQALYRGKRERMRWLQYKEKVIKVQSLYRGSRERKLWLQCKKSIVKLQALFRGSKIRYQYNQLKSNAIKLQSLYRGYSARKYFIKLQKSVLLCQSLFRKFRARRKFLLIKNASIKIQSFVRGFIVRSKYIKQKKAAVIIQSFTRGTLVRIKYCKLKAGVALIQQSYRSLCQDDSSHGNLHVSISKATAFPLSYSSTKQSLTIPQSALVPLSTSPTNVHQSSSSMIPSTSIHRYPTRSSKNLPQSSRLTNVQQKHKSHLFNSTLSPPQTVPSSSSTIYSSTKSSETTMQLPVLSFHIVAVSDTSSYPSNSKVVAVPTISMVNMPSSANVYTNAERVTPVKVATTTNRKSSASEILKNASTKSYNTRRNVRRQAACLVIQKYFRAYLKSKEARLKYLKIKNAVIIIQTWWRKKMQKRHACTTVTRSRTRRLSTKPLCKKTCTMCDGCSSHKKHSYHNSNIKETPNNRPQSTRRRGISKNTLPVSKVLATPDLLKNNSHSSNPDLISAKETVDSCLSYSASNIDIFSNANTESCSTNNTSTTNTDDCSTTNSWCTTNTENCSISGNRSATDTGNGPTVKTGNCSTCTSDTTNTDNCSTISTEHFSTTSTEQCSTTVGNYSSTNTEHCSTSGYSISTGNCSTTNVDVCTTDNSYTTTSSTDGSTTHTDNTDNCSPEIPHLPNVVITDTYAGVTSKNNDTKKYGNDIFNTSHKYKIISAEISTNDSSNCPPMIVPRTQETSNSSVSISNNAFVAISVYPQNSTTNVCNTSKHLSSSIQFEINKSFNNDSLPVLPHTDVSLSNIKESTVPVSSSSVVKTDFSNGQLSVMNSLQSSTSCNSSAKGSNIRTPGTPTTNCKPYYSSRTSKLAFHGFMPGRSGKSKANFGGFTHSCSPHLSRPIFSPPPSPFLPFPPPPSSRPSSAPPGYYSRPPHPPPHSPIYDSFRQPPYRGSPYSHGHHQPPYRTGHCPSPSYQDNMECHDYRREN